MHPVFQIVIGELIGIILMIAIFYLCTRADSFSTMIVYVVGLIILSGVFTTYFVGQEGLFISNDISKNIFFIMTFEELIVAVCAVATLYLFGSSKFTYTDKQLFSFFGYTVTISSLIFACFGLYPALSSIFI